MSVSVELPDELVSRARTEGAQGGRSVPEQIEFWAKVLRTAEDNPDLPIDFIKGILQGKAELEAGNFEPFDFDELK